MLANQQCIWNKVSFKQEHTLDKVLFWFVDKNVVNRGSQDPIPVFPLGAMVQFSVFLVTLWNITTAENKNQLSIFMQGWCTIALCSLPLPAPTPSLWLWVSLLQCVLGEGIVSHVPNRPLSASPCSCAFRHHSGFSVGRCSLPDRAWCGAPKLRSFPQEATLFTLSSVQGWLWDTSLSWSVILVSLASLSRAV